MIELSVIIPTRDRVDVLTETLGRLIGQETELAFEVLVVDDGSTDATVATARSLAEHSLVPLSVLEQESRGPAAARNRGLAAARGSACLFIGDDTWPRTDLVERHGRLHRRRPEPQAALLGHVQWAPESTPTPFMHWLNSGIQFDFGQITDPEDVRGSCFYTANVSAKRSFLLAHGGFDEAFAHAAMEDIELGLRLERAGMRLVYDADAVVEHVHPCDLPASLRRMRTLGRSVVILRDRVPDWPLPRRSGARHRVKAALLTVLNLIPQVRPSRLRHATWHFLCHQAFREACWGIEPRGDRPLRTGSALARLAARDPATRMSAFSGVTPLSGARRPAEDSRRST
ncbi:MAG: glycosyltransferase family 2 protein [Actinomycetota bacterium]|nr:glycosyltransferase family 2 protein [Actinomycetota bacterium]